MKSLKALLTASRIRSLASSVTIKRGQDYYARGRVQSLSSTFTGIRAYILGQRVYSVELNAIGKDLDYDCTCPMGEQGDFCKHCVAVAIAFLNDPRPKTSSPSKNSAPSSPPKPPPASPNSSSIGLPITNSSRTASTHTRPSSPGPTPPSPLSAGRFSNRSENRQTISQPTPKASIPR